MMMVFPALGIVFNFLGAPPGLTAMLGIYFFYQLGPLKLTFTKMFLLRDGFTRSGYTIQLSRHPYWANGYAWYTYFFMEPL